MHPRSAISFSNLREAQGQLEEIFHEQAFADYIAITNGDVVFDLGANIGMFSLYAAFAGATVVAVEPAPETFAILKENAKVAGENRIIPLPFGAGRDDQSKKLFSYNPMTPAGSGFYNQSDEHFVEAAHLRLQAVRKFAEDTALHDVVHILNVYDQHLADFKIGIKRHEVTVRSVSSLLQEYAIAELNLLKIDVEGAEFDVLQGIESGDWDKVQQVFLEVHHEDLLMPCRDILSVFPYIHVQQNKVRGQGAFYIYATRNPVNPQRLSVDVSLKTLDTHTATTLSQETFVKHICAELFATGVPANSLDMLRVSARIYDLQGFLLPISLLMSGDCTITAIAEALPDTLTTI